MKRLCFLFFTLCCVVFVFANETPIDLEPTPTPGPRPLSIVNLPVSATINEVQLAIYFDGSVVNATITVYNAFNQIVEQQVINTSDISEAYIPVYLWDSGDYTLSISYGNKTISGEFHKL
jgi:hypothetical protein